MLDGACDDFNAFVRQFAAASPISNAQVYVDLYFNFDCNNTSTYLFGSYPDLVSPNMCTNIINASLRGEKVMINYKMSVYKWLFQLCPRLQFIAYNINSNITGYLQNQPYPGFHLLIPQSQEFHIIVLQRGSIGTFIGSGLGQGQYIQFQHGQEHIHKDI